MTKQELSELDILTVLYYYNKNFHAYLHRIESDFFEDKFRTFFKVVQKHYKAYGCVPPESVFTVELQNQPDKAEHCKEILTHLSTNYEAIKNFTHEYLIDKLDIFTKKNFVRKSLIQSYEDLEQGEYDKIIKRMLDINSSIIDNDFGSEYHDDEFLEDRYNPEKSGVMIPTGFEYIDNDIGGWHNKSLNVIAGPSNSGKSMYLVNVAARVLLNERRHMNGGTKILYITLELPEDQIARRLDACITDTPMGDLWKVDREMLKEYIYKSRDSQGNYVVIKEMPGYKTNTNDLDALVRNIQLTQKVQFDMILVDYLGLMSPNNPSPRANTYEKGLAISVELRSLAQTYDIPIVVAAQTNRSSFSQDLDAVGQDNISDSIGIAQTADMMLTINRNKTLDAESRAMLYMAKSRYSVVGGKYYFDVKYDRMRMEDLDSSAVEEDEESDTESC
jgi:replicative DNA helicase